MQSVEVQKMTRKLVGVNCYRYFATLEEREKYEHRKAIEKNTFNATITEIFINNGLSFEAQRPKFRIQ